MANDPYANIASPAESGYDAISAVETPRGDAYESVATVAVPDRRTELRAYQEPNLIRRAITAVRESAAPLFGETPNQQLVSQQRNEEFARQFPQIAEQASKQASLAETEGAIPALFHPSDRLPQLPRIESAPGPAASPSILNPQIAGAPNLSGLAAGIYNPIAGAVNSAIASPGGLLTLPISGPLREAKGIEQLVSGLFAADQARQTVENLPHAIGTITDPNATLQQKVEAGAGEVLSAGLSGLSAQHAIAEARRLPPNQATLRLREEAATTANKETAAALENLAADIEKQAADAAKAQEQRAKAVQDQVKAAEEQQRAATQVAQAALTPPEAPKSTQIIEEANAPKSLANQAASSAKSAEGNLTQLQAQINRTAVPTPAEMAPLPAPTEAAPGALSVPLEVDTKPAQIKAAVKSPDTEYLYTVQRPMVPGGKGFIQVDAINPALEGIERNVVSSNPADLRKAGADIPDVPEWVPQGQYTRDQIKEFIKQGEPAHAIQEQSPSQGVLRAPETKSEPVVELPRVGEGNAVNKEAAGTPRNPSPPAEPIELDKLSKSIAEEYGIRIKVEPVSGVNDQISISVIEVPESKRGSGVGSKALDDVKKYADENNLKITLTASGAENQSLVEKFYEKSGFKKIGNDPLSGKPMYGRLPNEGIRLKPAEPISLNGISESRLVKLADDLGIDTMRMSGDRLRARIESNARPEEITAALNRPLSEAEQLLADSPSTAVPQDRRGARQKAAAVRAQRAGLISGTALERVANDTIKRINREGRANSGLDPEYLAAHTVKLLGELERGVVDFAEWSARTIKEAGESIRPKLRAIWDEAQKKFNTPPDVPIYEREDMGPNSAATYDRDIPTITNKRQKQYAEDLAGYAARTGNWTAAYEKLRQLPPEYTPVAAAELAVRAQEIKDPVVREAAIRNFATAALDSTSQAGQTLQSASAANKTLEPLTGYMAFLGLVRKRLADVVEPAVGPDAGGKVRKGLNDAGKVAGGLAGDTADGAPPVKISDINALTNDLAKAPEVNPALGDQIMGMVQKSAGYRDFFTKKGVGGIARRFAEILKSKGPEGNVWTFDSIVTSELSQILSDKMKAAGLEAPKNKRLTTPERIAQFLSSDPLRGDKVALIDAAVREEIAKRPEAEQQVLTEAWEASVGAMGASPTSISTARTIIQEALKELGVKWNQVFKAGDLAATKARVLKNIESRIRKVGAGTEALDLTQFNEAVGAVFDEIAGIRKKSYEKSVRLAEERERAQASPEAEANRIVRQYAKIQSDTPSISSAQEKPVAAAVSDYISNKVDRDGFLALTDKLGIKRATSETLETIISTEKKRRELWAGITAHEKLIERLSKHDALVAPLRRIAQETGADWKTIFTDLPENQAARKAELFKRISEDPRFSAISEATKQKLADAAERAWETIRNDVFRREFGRLVDLPNIKPETKVKIEETFPEIIKQANLGLLDNESFLSALGKQYGIEGLDSATASKLRTLGEEAMRAPRGSERNRVFQQIEDTLLHTRGISWPALVRDVWYRNVMSAPRTAVEIGLGGVVQGLHRTVETALDTAFAQGRPDLAFKMLGMFFKDAATGTRLGGDLIATGDRTSLPRYEKRFLESMDRLKKGESPGGEVESLYRRSGTAGKIAYGPFEMVGRVLTALDYIGGQGVRQQQMLYAALVRGDKASLAAAMQRFDTNATKLAAEQAAKELPNGRPAERIARQKEILNDGISDEIKEFGNLMTEVTALNAAPVGIAGQVYRGLNSIPFFSVAKFPAGAAFLKAGLNLFQRYTDFLPGTGQLNYLRSKIDPNTSFGKIFSLKDLPVERQRQQIVAQYMGLAALGATAAYFINNKDKDVEISGSWFGLSPEQQRQLRTAGEAPLSFKAPWTGGRWVSYRLSPLLPVFGIVGHWRDQERFNGKKFDDKTLSSKVVNSWLAGAVAIKDLSLASQASELVGGLIGKDSGAPDADKGLKAIANSVGSTAAGLIPLSSFWRELDQYEDQQRYVPGKDNPGVDLWLRQVPFVRRLANDGADGNARPALDFFGNPVKVVVTPFNRHLAPLPPEGTAYKAVSDKISQGMIVPVPAPLDHVINAKAELVPPTSDQDYAYQKAVRQAYQRQVEADLPAFMAASPEQASEYSQKVMQRAAQYVRDRMNTGKPFEVTSTDAKLSPALSPEYQAVRLANAAERGPGEQAAARVRVNYEDISALAPEDRGQALRGVLQQNLGEGRKVLSKMMSKTETRDALQKAEGALQPAARAAYFRTQIAKLPQDQHAAYLTREYQAGNLSLDVLRELAKNPTP